MDCAEIKVEMAEGGLLDPLVIVEEGDETEAVTLENSAESGGGGGGGGLKREEEPAGGDRNEAVKACAEKRQSDAEEDPQGEAVVTQEVKEQNDKPEETESTNDGQDGGDSEEEGKTNAATSRDVNSGLQAVKVPQDDLEVDTQRLDPSEREPEETKSREEDLKKVCGLFLFYCGTKRSPPPPPHPRPHQRFKWLSLRIMQWAKCLFAVFCKLANQPPSYTLQEKQSLRGRKKKKKKAAGITLLQGMWE